MEFWVSYGPTEVPVRVPDDNFYRVLEPSKPETEPQGLPSLLEAALENPLGNVPLSSITRPGGTACILADPAIPIETLDSILTVLRTRLTSLGASKIHLLFRTRSNPSTRGEWRMINPVGDTFVDVGSTSRGTPVAVDETFRSSDLRILLGMVQPHFASGFAGGPDLVLPGASSLKTIEANRRLLLNMRPDQSTSLEENQVYQDSLEATRMIGPSTLVTVVLDRWGRVANVCAGEPEATFKEATSQYARENSWPLDVRPDIIVVSSDGPYYSSDLYHAVRILPFVSSIQKRDGSTIVLAGECRNGIGDTTFLRYSKENEDARTLESSLKRQGFKLGSHVALLLKRSLENSRVQLVSVLPDVYTRSLGLKPSRTVSAGVQSAIRAEGKDAKVLIIPKGSQTIPTITSQAS